MVRTVETAMRPAVEGIRVRSLEPGEQEAWDAIAGHHLRGTIYHTLDWLHVIERSYRCRVHRLVAEKDGVLLGLLPLVEMHALFRGGTRLVSLPFSNYGGPLGEAGVNQTLLDAAEDLGRTLNISYAEFRGATSPLTPSITTRSDYVSPVLDLSGGPDVVWNSRLHGKARNHVRKGERSGLSVKTGVDHLESFVSLYQRRQHDLGTPSHGWTWFRSMAELLAPSLDVVIVHRGRQAVGGVLLLFHGTTALAQYGASLEEAHPFCPNHAAYWRAIVLACQRGCLRFDFGRTLPDTGTYSFKLGWGAVPEETPYHYLLCRASEGPKPLMARRRYRWAATCWRHLPLPLASRIGPWLRPYLAA